MVLRGLLDLLKDDTLSDWRRLVALTDHGAGVLAPERSALAGVCQD